jgi:hypothetical protein
MRGLSKIKNQDSKNMKKESWWMKDNHNYERRDDDSRNSTLRVVRLETGEVKVGIYNWDNGEYAEVGFPEYYVGGGRSPKVRKALENLAQAIEEDNKEHPIEKWLDVGHKQFLHNQLILNNQRRKREKL